MVTNLGRVKREALWRNALFRSLLKPSAGLLDSSTALHLYMVKGLEVTPIAEGTHKQSPQGDKQKHTGSPIRRNPGIVPLLNLSGNHLIS